MSGANTLQAEKGSAAAYSTPNSPKIIRNIQKIPLFLSVLPFDFTKKV
jgi:hypothetical protein